MNLQDYIKAEMSHWRNMCFKDHVATAIAQTDKLTLIEFRNPKSLVYGMRFLVHGPWVCVMGDIYEATYQLSGTVTLEFLAGIDFGYFHGKCRASSNGWDFNGWDNNVAERGVNDFLSEIDESDRGSKRDYVAELRSIEIFDKDEIQRVAREAYDETGDCETAAEIHKFGDVPDACCIGHFVGIQMAIAQLKSKTEVAP